MFSPNDFLTCARSVYLCFAIDMEMSIQVRGQSPAKVEGILDLDWVKCCCLVDLALHGGVGWGAATDG